MDAGAGGTPLSDVASTTAATAAAALKRKKKNIINIVRLSAKLIGKKTGWCSSRDTATETKASAKFNKSGGFMW